MGLGDMLVTYSADVGNLISGSDMAKSAISSVEDTASSSGGGILGAFQSAGSGLMSFVQNAGMTLASVQTLGQGAIDLASNLLQPAATAETTTFAFSTLLHSMSGAKAEMQALNTYASGTPMQTQWVDDAATKMLAFGFTTKDIIPDITAIGDNLAALGKLTGPQLASIVDIFGKINVEGKLTGGTMMELSRNGIPAWQALSDATGKPIPVLQKMVSQGLIPAKEGIEDLRKGMEKAFGGTMAGQANTFSGLMSTVASNWQIAMAAIGGPALKLAESGLSGLASTLSSSGFQTFATGVGQKIADTLSTIGKFAQANVVPAMHDVGQAFQQVGVYIQGDQFQGFIADIETVGNQIGRMLTPLQGATTQLPKFSTVLNGIGSVLSGTVIPALDSVAFGIGQFLMWLQKGGIWVDVFKAGLIGIGVAFAAIQIGSFIATIPALVVGFATWAVGAWTAAAGTIAATWPLLALGAAIAIVAGIIYLAVTHWSDITKFLEGAWRSTLAWLTSALGAIGAWFGSVWQNIQKDTSSFLGFIGSSIQSGMKSVFDFFMSPINLIGQAFVWLYDHNKYFKMMVDAIVSDATRLSSWLSNTWTSIKNAVMNAFLTVYLTAERYWFLVYFTVQAWMYKAESFLQGVWTSITGTVSTAAHNVWQKVVDMWTQISTVFENAWNTYIAKPLDSVWNSISSTIDGWGKSAYNSGANFISMLASGITNGTSVIGKAVSGIASTIWKNLGFSSPTKEGILSTSDKWMPRFIGMMSDGLTQGAPQVNRAATVVAQNMAYPIRPNTSAVASIASSSTLARGGDMHTHVYMDSKEIMHDVQKRTDAHVRLKYGSKGRAA